MTVLFTDLVGSTELMARLGEDAYDEVRAEHFAGLREVLAAHQGTEVKNTGDGLMATFASAANAVAASVAMQQAASRHTRSHSTPRPGAGHGRPTRLRRYRTASGRRPRERLTRG